MFTYLINYLEAMVINIRRVIGDMPQHVLLREQTPLLGEDREADRAPTPRLFSEAKTPTFEQPQNYPNFQIHGM